MKVLFLIGTGVAVPHIITSAARAVKALGHKTELLPLYQGQDVFSDILKINPELTIALDHTGLPHKEMGDAKFPHCSWFVDHPLYFVKPGDFNPFHMAAVSDRSFRKTLTKLGCEQSFYCPLAYDPELFSFSMEWRSRQDVSLSFVGSFPGAHETLLAERQKHADSFFNTVLDAALHVKRMSPEGGLSEILEFVEQKSGLAFLDKMSATQLSSLMLILDRESESFVKTEMVRLFAGADFRIHGNDLWKTDAAAAPLFHGAIRYEKELADLYRRSRINIVLTRAQLAEGVNQRVFDIPAAGGFFLCDYRKDLEDIFPGIWQRVVFRNLAELKEKADYFLSRPEERFEITEALFACLREKHSYRTRMKEFLEKSRSLISTGGS